MGMALKAYCSATATEVAAYLLVHGRAAWLTLAINLGIL
jgi:hypothetical protein